MAGCCARRSARRCCGFRCTPIRALPRSSPFCSREFIGPRSRATSPVFLPRRNPSAAARPIAWSRRKSPATNGIGTARAAAAGGNSANSEKAMIWRGVPLGFDRDGRPIGYGAGDEGDGNAPTLVFGPPGSFKTVGLVATQLLDDDSGKRSYVVIDPKGEICAVTSRFRRTVSEVKIINPYGLLVDERPDMKSDGFNALDDLNPDNALTFGDECQAKGDALIKTGSNEHQPHFPDSARSGVTATLMFEVKAADAEQRPRSLPQVRRILTQPPEALRASVQKM